MNNLDEIKEMAVKDAKVLIDDWLKTKRPHDVIRKPSNIADEDFDYYLNILLVKINEKRESLGFDFEILDKQKSHAQLTWAKFPFKK
jgi:hypothetical protein